MKTLKIALAALATTVAFAAPASAANLATLGDAGLRYGTLTASGFTDYTAYAAGAPQCLGYGACYVGNDTYAIIAKASPTQLLAHPGPGTPGGVFGNSAIGLSASAAGDYFVNALASSADQGAKTVGYFTIIGGTLTTFDVGSISGSATQAISQRVTLGASDLLGVFVNNGDGNYNFDSTTFSGSIAAVPEPATWAMMIGGVGLVGGAMRRRRSAAPRLATA